MQLYWFYVIDLRKSRSLKQFEAVRQFSNSNDAYSYFIELVGMCKSGPYYYLCKWGEGLKRINSQPIEMGKKIKLSIVERRIDYLLSESTKRVLTDAEMDQLKRDAGITND